MSDPTPGADPSATLGADPSATLGADPHGTAERISDSLQRNGASVVFRKQSKGPLPAGLINPPRVQVPTLAAFAPVGAELVQIGATSASGQLLPGDMLVLDGLRFRVVAAAAALPPTRVAGFANVAISPPLPQALQPGTPVGFLFMADVPAFARIASFPRKLVDGERILSRDLDIMVSAWQLGEIKPGAWSVIVNGREMAIVDATPAFRGNEIVTWQVQAR